MGYIIEPMPLIAFLEESKLKLPRFQRKATWDKKQNFELAISVFQDYPVGVVIVNQEQKASWLLDGRQRRSALIAMRDNPVELYEWARNYIGFSKTADDLDVATAYWNKVERYLQTEAPPESEDEDSPVYDGEEPDLEPDEENSFDSTKQRQGLKTLLDLVLMVHQNKPSGSKWEQLFDFRKQFKRLKYAPIKNGSKIDPRLLRKFILEFSKAVDDENDGNLEQDFFVDFYLQNADPDDEVKFRKEVAQRWDSIVSSINVIEHAEKVFTDARIGIIRLTNASPLDAQNIFSRINRGGTQLKAEELLSAKPYWNKSVDNVSPELRSKIKSMYEKLDIPTPEEIVRWDIAATFISQIRDEHLIFDTYKDAHKKNEVSMDEISLGFKLLGSIYEGGMSNKHVNNLESNTTINWNDGVYILAQELGTVCHNLAADSFFKYFQSWKRPLAKLMGNAIALEFITIIWLDWKDRGRPVSVSGELKALQRDARILLDKLMFEYATKTWRGSGDSKMSNDIKDWKNRLSPVKDDDWQNFILGACSGEYNGQTVSVKLLRPVLYYYYSISEISPLNEIDISFDVDHIIPQELFKGNTMVSPSTKDSLINLALLPTKENITKKAKRLNEISDSWLKNSISTYSQINVSYFDELSDVANIGELKNIREPLFRSVFGAKRKSMLIN